MNDQTDRAEPTPADPTPPPTDSATGTLEPDPSLSSDARQMAMFCHLASFAGMIGIPLGNIIGPLIIWLIKKDEHAFVDDQGKEALNFQITMTIAALLCIPLVFLFCIGAVLAIALWVFDVIVTIIAAIKANEGVAYRYPFTLRLIK